MLNLYWVFKVLEHIEMYQTCCCFANMFIAGHIFNSFKYIYIYLWRNFIYCWSHQNLYGNKACFCSDFLSGMVHFRLVFCKLSVTNLKLANCDLVWKSSRAHWHLSNMVLFSHCVYSDIFLQLIVRIPNLFTRVRKGKSKMTQ